MPRPVCRGSAAHLDVLPIEEARRADVAPAFVVLLAELLGHLAQHSCRHAVQLHVLATAQLSLV